MSLTCSPRSPAHKHHSINKQVRPEAVELCPYLGLGCVVLVVAREVLDELLEWQLVARPHSLVRHLVGVRGEAPLVERLRLEKVAATGSSVRGKSHAPMGKTWTHIADLWMAARSVPGLRLQRIRIRSCWYLHEYVLRTTEPCQTRQQRTNSWARRTSTTSSRRW